MNLIHITRLSSVRSINSKVFNCQCPYSGILEPLRMHRALEKHYKGNNFYGHKVIGIYDVIVDHSKIYFKLETE